jgi:hypothetical protein
MNRLQITILPDGSLHSLQKRTGPDLRALGNRSIVRVSEIVWNEQAQGWQVEFKQGPFAGRALPLEALYNIAEAPPRIILDGCPVWEDYESAVAAEVAVVEAAQASGETWWMAAERRAA